MQTTHTPSGVCVTPQKEDENMINLFKRCLNAEYITTAESGDYAIEVEGNTLYILFEWSDGAVDWRNNFDFPATPYKSMTEKWFCHRGFLKVWKAMRDEIESCVALILRQNTEISEIVIVGYSHGGAMAFFATEDMSYLYGEKYAVRGYGFGAPRVLWGYAPKALRERISAFVTVRNIPDIVTHLPPKIFGFRDINIKEIGERGKYKPIKAHYNSAYIAELNNK